MKRSHLRKLVIIGTTGSGKTTFLKNLVGEFEGAEVDRKVTIEEAQVINTFSVLDKEQYINSTTTVSMNVKSVLFLTTRSNQFQFYPLNSPQLRLNPDEMDNLYPTVLVDTAGQERFNFMQDIGLKGADGVIIFADGTNVQSIERIAHFVDLIKEEEKNQNRKIPKVVFINKKDLEAKGLFIGKESLDRWLPEISVDVFETSNKDIESFNLAIRNFLNRIEGFPVDISQIHVNSVHEVY